MAVTSPELYSSMGLNNFEFDSILNLMGREPTLAELGMFAVMWSEHCGYKYSKKTLSRFGEYKKSLEGAGLENAGVVDIGDGLGITFKVESHNHPSAVEPYQGAATGVGGIIRDILTMGARPIASLNSLRFGPLQGNNTSASTLDRNRYLFERVVAGIAGYGNCVGVPTVAGEVDFHPSYSGNPLVNAMCVGVLDLDKVTTSAAAGVGNSVVYMGSRTGKDGIHGATFASDSLDEKSESRRPNVQIGDPFAEKSLIEATLEALQTGAIVAIQDMGAAGLTCSTVEMASKGPIGMEVDLDLVPMRESDMTAYELLLSESQERMLAVVEAGREQEVLSVFEKWGLPAAIIGRVVDGKRLQIFRFGKKEVDVDPRWLADECPTYATHGFIPEEVEVARGYVWEEVKDLDFELALFRLLAAPEIGSKSWIYRQFDRHVQTQTILSSGEGEAAVLRIRGCKKGIAISIAGNSRQVRFDPKGGSVNVVAEAARNIACTGAKPVAATDGLNFGDPTHGEVFWQFQQSVEGLAAATEAFESPVLSGNVSFYNRTDSGQIPPTPIIGMIGLLEDPTKVVRSFPKAGDFKKATVFLVDASKALEGEGMSAIGASAFAFHVLGIENGVPIVADLQKEASLHRLLAELAEKSLILAAHDAAQGGLGVCLAELCVGSKAGGIWQLPSYLQSLDSASAVFGEWPGQVLICAEDVFSEEIQSLTTEHGLAISKIGVLDSSTQDFRIQIGDKTLFETSIQRLTESFDSAYSVMDSK